MDKVRRIIGMRDVDPSIRNDFMEFIKSDVEEANQIKNGYTNILAVSMILKARAECIRELEV